MYKSSHPRTVTRDISATALKETIFHFGGFYETCANTPLSPLQPQRNALSLTEEQGELFQAEEKTQNQAFFRTFVRSSTNKMTGNPIFEHVHKPYIGLYKLTKESGLFKR